MNAQDAQITGHIKEIAGLMAGDKELQKQGKSERRAAEVQSKIEQVTDVVRGAVDKTLDTVVDALDKSNDDHTP